jgi:hypothetical protein
MFITWGTKRVSKRRGYVADFCPMCRQIQPMSIQRIGVAGHIYGISLSEGQLAGHTRVCSACATDLDTTTDRYASIAKKQTGLHSLIQTTFPNITEHYRTRLEIEAKINDPQPPSMQTKQLLDSVRPDLVEEPFNILSNVVEERFSNTHIDARFAGVSAVVFVTVFVLVANARSWGWNEPLTLVLLLLLGIAIITYEYRQQKRRYLCKHIYPKLAAVLRPLRPHQTEIQNAAAKNARSGAKFGRAFRLDDFEACRKLL